MAAGSQSPPGRGQPLVVALEAGRHGGLPLQNITKPGNYLGRAVLAWAIRMY